ncbi:MAG: YihA family ribosome biogenesis GTP-binding protein [Spirochaetaceae bacterium]|nr:YihA family ribosome biogenesis GTP-binding protein [Spirochaetaceae bacterium]RKX83072.1 MAG: YihA family ribosome biogenesis GTP-binding protein [Spirochaetota bacterium]
MIITALLKDIRFITSSPNYHSLPLSTGAEAAFAGRSNAGKSSVLNTLTNRKALAKTSSTPGKTRHINLFALDKEKSIRLADLPGYGYAKVNVREQQRWGEELTLYITERESLKGVVIVMDIRHPLTENDKQMVVLCRTGGRPVHVLLNKADKLKSGRRAATVKQVEKDLAYLSPGATYSTFSALKGEGIKELRDVLNRWLNGSED